MNDIINDNFFIDDIIQKIKTMLDSDFDFDVNKEKIKSELDNYSPDELMKLYYILFTDYKNKNKDKELELISPSTQSSLTPPPPPNNNFIQKNELEYENENNMINTTICIDLENMNESNEIIIDFEQIKQKHQFDGISNLYLSFSKKINIHEIEYLFKNNNNILSIDKINGDILKFNSSELCNELQKYIIKLDLIPYDHRMQEPFLSHFVIKIKLAKKYNILKSRLIFEMFNIINLDTFQPPTIQFINQTCVNYFSTYLTDNELGHRITHILPFKSNMKRIFINLIPKNEEVSLELKGILRYNNIHASIINNDIDAVNKYKHIQYYKKIYPPLDKLKHHYELSISVSEMVENLSFSYYITSCDRIKTEGVKVEIYLPRTNVVQYENSHFSLKYT